METFVRPIALKQNQLRYPLNDILGTHAHVRLLRIMILFIDNYISVLEISKHTGNYCQYFKELTIITNLHNRLDKYLHIVV